MDEFEDIIAMLTPVILAKREAVIAETLKPTDYNTPEVQERKRLLGLA